MRELLLRKKEKLLDQLKALTATIPTTLISATSNKFSDLERQLKTKAGSIEDVDAQRKWVTCPIASLDSSALFASLTAT